MALATGMNKGFRGMIDGVIYRLVGDKTVASKAPSKPSKKKRKLLKERQSIPQRMTRERFQNASREAKEKLRDPKVRSLYERRAKRRGYTNARIALMSEILKPVPARNNFLTKILDRCDTLFV